MSNPPVTIITPTTGKISLSKTLSSCGDQNVAYEHILLWDDVRDTKDDPYLVAKSNQDEISGNGVDCTITSIVIQGKMVKGKAAGSALRAIGLMAAKTPFVTFADDDVWFEKDHLASLLRVMDGKRWSYGKRKIWTKEGECLGVDDFESVGDSESRKVPYEMVDNNSMLFARKFGASAACLYRETEGYDDDRLMYGFLKKYAGVPGKTNHATVHQICPDRLEGMFRKGCTRV